VLFWYILPMKLLLSFLLLSSILFASLQLPIHFRANFTQKVTNPKDKVLQYRGQVSFSDTKHFKWSYTEPTQKEVCTDGFELLVVDHDLEQVSTYYISKGLDIAKVLNTAILHQDNIYIAYYNSIKYTIEVDEKQQLLSIAYLDALENKVQILFTQMKYGKKPLSPKQIECSSPIDYDRIKG